MEQFEREHVDVIALSVDPLDKAREMVERVHATFPIAYGLQVSADAAYWEERRKINHATNFIIDPAKKYQSCIAPDPLSESSQKTRYVHSNRKKEKNQGNEVRLL
jgi:peroxiredoxin